MRAGDGDLGLGTALQMLVKLLAESNRGVRKSVLLTFV